MKTYFLIGMNKEIQSIYPMLHNSLLESCNLSKILCINCFAVVLLQLLLSKQGKDGASRLRIKIKGSHTHRWGSKFTVYPGQFGKGLTWGRRKRINYTDTLYKLIKMFFSLAFSLEISCNAANN